MPLFPKINPVEPVLPTRPPLGSPRLRPKPPWGGPPALPPVRIGPPGKRRRAGPIGIQPVLPSIPFEQARVATPAPKPKMYFHDTRKK